ncbi:hypothetical protein Tco_0278131 [Tanacetum coccineum]
MHKLNIYSVTRVLFILLRYGTNALSKFSPDTELVLYPIQDKLTSGDKSLDLSALNYPAYSSVSCLQGLLVVRDRMGLNIAYTVSCLSQFMHCPLKSHLKTALKVIRYVKDCLRKGINVIKTSVSGTVLKSYSDADWARCTDTRRSVSGFCIFMNESLVSWKSKKQNTISKSSTEAEYRTLASVTSEVIWVLKILKDLYCSNLLPVKVFCDNNSIIRIAANPIFHERTKHLEIDLYLLWGQVAKKLKDEGLKLSSWQTPQLGETRGVVKVKGKGPMD